MNGESLSLHRTTTIRIHDQDGDGWEFACKKCNYRARYMERFDRGERVLVVLDLGDPQARHTSSQQELGQLGDWPLNTSEYAGSSENELEDLEEVNLSYDEEAWITPEIRFKLEEILKRLDKDNGERP